MLDTRPGHARWVRISHWIIAASVLTLAVTGFVILMAHPRLYWGAVGNDLTPALLELPISRNHRHGGWEPGVAFSAHAGAAVSATRTYDILNENSWGRSLHFLAAWFLVVTGIVYVSAGICSGHVRRHLLPRAAEFTPRLLWQDVTDAQTVRGLCSGSPDGGQRQAAGCAGVAHPFVDARGVQNSDVHHEAADTGCVAGARRGGFPAQQGRDALASQLLQHRCVICA